VYAKVFFISLTCALKFKVIKYFCVSKVIVFNHHSNPLRHFKFFISFLGILSLLLACNPTKDKWMNRNWHTMTGRFNVYFNGEIKYIEVIQALEKGHQNDFTKILDVFPYGDEAASKGVAGQLDIVLKKASLSVQNHYVGRYTDNSYFLMGKAHYFKRDYYAAMEAFQYINARYKNQGLRPISTAWIAKCYTGLQKVDEAEAVMGLLLSEENAKLKKQSLYRKVFPETPKEYTREIYATAADIAIRQEKYSTAAEKLKIALDFTSEKKDRIRYTYILGQLYAQMDSVKLANQYFGRILKMLAPYDFEFNASINLARSYDPTDQGAVKRVRRALKRMLRDDKNDGFYDQIWYELGVLETKEKNIPSAIKAFKMAAFVPGKNTNQKALAYLALGNIYLDMPDYKLAQAYYDSTAASISPSYKNYQKIIDKKTVLSDLIDNLIAIETEDSLQAIAKLSKVDIEKKIDQWIVAAKLDSANAVKRAKDKKEAEKLAQMNPQGAIANANTAGFGEQGQWYFYNPTMMVSGAAEFFSSKKWGQRANEDYWRIAAMEKEKQDDTGTDAAEADSSAGEKDKAPASDGATDGETKGEVSQRGNPGISGDRQAWIADVPFTAKDLRQSNDRLALAYFNIGVIYDEKLADAKEAIKDYELLLKRFPKSEYEPEVLYKMYKLYTQLKQTDKAAAVKNKLIQEYPQSPYALILQNKSISSAESDANKEVVLFYEQVYQKYVEGSFAEVKQQKKEADKKFPGNALQPKFDLLYAMAVGRSESIPQFQAELTEVAARYPKTDVGDRAAAILKAIKKQSEVQIPDSLKPAEADFTIDESGPFYFVIAIKDDKLDMNELIGRIMSYNEEYNEFDNLRANPMLSNDGYQLLLVREFKEFNKALSYHSDFKLRDGTKKRLQYDGPTFAFVISVPNFKKMLKEKKVDSYNTIFVQYEKSKPVKP
jgi:tetratricopeptide (TPR) repeat protein